MGGAAGTDEGVGELGGARAAAGAGVAWVRIHMGLCSFWYKGLEGPVKWLGVRGPRTTWRRCPSR